MKNSGWRGSSWGGLGEGKAHDMMVPAAVSHTAEGWWQVSFNPCWHIECVCVCACIFLLKYTNKCVVFC